MAVGLSGCPVAADLENPDRFPALASTTGGSGPTGGSGGAPMGGSGGSAPNCEAPLPDDATVMCNWRAALGARNVSGGFCAKSGCHNVTTAAGNLNLATILNDAASSPDLLFASRLLNVPASHEILCGTMMCDPTVPTCDKCATCPGTRPVLLSTQNPGQGWIFDKINAFIPGTHTTTQPMGCGDAMPTYNTTGTGMYTEDHKQCLIRFFTEIAKTPGTWPCGQATGGSGGSGAGSGGASGGGAGPMSGAGGT